MRPTHAEMRSVRAARFQRRVFCLGGVQGVSWLLQMMWDDVGVGGVPHLTGADRDESAVAPSRSTSDSVGSGDPGFIH
eukprot:5041640-Pyramimonas_sp.AAC.1